MKRLISLLLALLLFCGAISFASAEGQETFTWWIAKGEDTSYYDNYAQNPIVRYLLDSNTYNGKQVNLEFWQGVAGAEQENFNNMLSTGDLADVIDLSYCDYTPAELCEEGFTLDLTPYVEQYMPNYWKLIHEKKEWEEYAFSMVDGEKKILFLVNFCSMAEPFEGYLYRRDWVAKYGTNPQTGAAFTWSVDENGAWTDDVVFPCGKTDPYYISDWEWMFEIFTRAMADQGITDGYCISLYYEGFMSTGDLASGFGGGCPWWYRDAEGNAAFGATSDNTRAYLKAMNTWWNNGWIDPHFAERSGDMFYIIDSKSVHQGKVGMWQGRQSEVGRSMDIGTPLTEGIMVYGAPQPINDVYGGDEQKNREPDTYYTLPPMSRGVAVTAKAGGKDLPTLLTFMDTLYGPEIGNLGNNGFSAEMIAAMDDTAYWKQLYLKFGATEGVWHENGGDYYYSPGVDMLLANALKLNRLAKADGYKIRYTPESRSAELQHAMDLWLLYPNTGFIRDNVTSLLSSRDNSKRSKIEGNVRTYMDQSMPKFIMGQKDFDINNDTDWANFCKVIDKYGAEKVTEIYQEAMNQLK